MTEAFKVSITGIDGAGKDTIARRSLQQISADEQLAVAKLGRPAYMIHNGEMQQIFRRTTTAIDRLHERCDRLTMPSLITAANALNVIVQTRALERTVDTHGFDIVASSRDPRVDPTVYFDFYGGGIANHMALERRGRLLQRLTGVTRDLIILLEVDPTRAIERIEARIAKETAGQASLRPKWRHIHENVDDLTMLAAGYRTALDALSCLDETAIVRVDTNDKNEDEVTQEVVDTITSHYWTKRLG